MNYNSIQEILSAGITNMQVLRNNTKQDDGTDTIIGVPWFTYNGITASTIYASGNSFIGFGTSTEHLKVNRRDGVMYSLYREEGTLCNYYNFLKIRWDGYTTYNQTSASYRITYDVILWDTGDISLHMVTIPTSQNNGTYSLTADSTYTYTVNSANPDVTFKKTNSGFSVSNSLINLEISSILIRSGSSYYTIENNALSKLEVTELTSELFIKKGVKSVPSLSLLSALTNPEILFWTNMYTTGATLTIKGIPPLPQVVYFDTQDMTNYLTIKNLECFATNDVLFSISTDDGQTWKYYNNKSWNINNSSGMNIDTLQSITSDEWLEILTGATSYRFRCLLPNTTSSVGKIYINHILKTDNE